MSSATNDIYQHVPPEQVEQLTRFRAEHPTKQANFKRAEWEYIAGGEGEHTLLLLNGL